ncbi:hypothetical protein NXS19_011304 [Fusarium pseudograminearum]|nr:hypothetical protein NXS19_011304 [Fusarium pseudograminearum]
MSSALEAAKICQPDALVLQGSDAGGHGHAHGASLITLIPEVVDALENEGIANIPLIAAGGIMDGRSAAAAVMLGASGVVMGTRYLGAKEANFDANVREAVFSTTDAGKATVRSRLFDDIWDGTSGLKSMMGDACRVQSTRTSNLACRLRGCRQNCTRLAASLTLRKFQ